MALRAEDDNSNSPLPGLSYFWQEAEKPPGYDWEQWVQLFEVAVLARHSTISMTELLRVADQQNPRNAAMMGNLDEIPAKKTSKLNVHIHWENRKKDANGQIPEHQHSANRATKFGAKLHRMFPDT